MNGMDRPAADKAASGGFRHRLFAQPGVHLSLAVLGVYAALAVAVDAGGLAAGWPLRAGAPWQGISLAHWLGTNAVGQDIALRVLAGAAGSFAVGVIVTAGALGLGTGLGALAGSFAGRRLDGVLQWLMSVIDAVPFYLLAAAVLFAFAGHAAALYVTLIVSFWTTPARLVRGEVRRLERREFVIAARLLGVPRLVALVRHVLPNALPVIVAQGLIIFVLAIKTEVVLSFIGLGETGGISWGVLLAESAGEVPSGHFGNFIGATVMMAGLILAANRLAESLQVAADPRMAAAGRTAVG